MAYAERVDGNADIEEYFDLPISMAGISEDACEELFLAMPSGARH
jgi:hypothetical protein